jgi:hypothetical protein
MSQTQSCRYRIQKWYSKQIFPLVPLLEIKKEDEYNTSGFTFRWLFLTVWVLDSFKFEFAIVADTHWGIGFVGILPYLRWVFAIPCPVKLGIWIDNKLQRQTTYQKNLR